MRLKNHARWIWKSCKLPFVNEMQFYIKEKNAIFEVKNQSWLPWSAAELWRQYLIMKQLFFILFLLSSVTSFAVRDEFSVSYLGVESGLSNNHVTGITQDKRGFIWIATDEGLSRFDGHHFKTYYKDEISESSSITGNELNGIIDDPRRPIVWIATQRAGLDAYDYEKGEFRSYRHSQDDPSSLITDDVTAVAPASDGGIWVATFSGGIDYLDPDTGKFIHFNSGTVRGLPDASVWSVADGGDGYLYVAHEFAGFSIIDIKKKTSRHFIADPGNPTGLPSSHLNCVYKDSLNNVWLGTDRGPVLYNQDGDTFTSFGDFYAALRHSVGAIRQFSNNLLWVAMERGGIAVMELSDSLFSHPENVECTTLRSDFGPNHLSSPSVRCLYEDDYSNVWAGSWGGGVNIISRNAPPFRLHPARVATVRGEVLSANSVLSVSVDNDNRIWVGKDSGVLEMYDGERLVNTFSKEKGNLPGAIVQASYKDPSGAMWFGFFNEGACRYDKSSGRFIPVFPASSRVDVRDITSDSGGGILFASSGGMWRYDPGRDALEGPFEVGNNLVRCVLPLSADTLLIGTFGAGMIVTDSDFKEIRRYDVNSGIPSNTVNHILRTRDNRIYVATGEGLLCFDDISGSPDNIRVYNRASGLANSHILAVVQDRSGCIWFSTNGGISCLRGGDIYNYTHRDHVPIGNFFGRSVASDRQGNIYFGAVSGLCVFNPVKVLEKVAAPQPMIVELSMLGDMRNEGIDVQVTGKKEVRLEPGQNSFDVFFSSRNFALAGEVEYAYMLEGVADSWVMPRNGNIATFRDLSPGTYVFKVKCRVRNQDWGEPASLKIVLPPPFWLSWWAKTLYLLALLALVGTLLYLYRKRINAEAQLKTEKERHMREQELNDERLRFYTNITHELRTPLTLIVGPLEDLAKDPSIPEKGRNSLGMVRRNAGRLLDLVNRILEFRKTETQNRRLCVRRGNIAATVYEVSLKYKELNRNSDVKVEVSTESGDMQTFYDKEVVQVVLDNLISNSLKYTPKGNVKIDCRKEEGNIVISVADTGVGISRSALSHIFDRYYQEKGPHQAAGTGIGLSLVKNLVTLHHGTVTVSSEEGKGTEFVVSLPADEAYPEALHIEEESAEESPVNTASEPETPVGDRKPLILVVEDNEDIREYIKQSFTDLYDVRTAENGKEGLERAFEIMPSLVVSDIMMPEMDGVEMTRRLKGDVRTSHIPVILLTAKESESDREEGYAGGADSYLTKPFSSSLLQSRINNLILQRMKLTERFACRPEPVVSEGDDTIVAKRERLLKSLSEVDRKFMEKINRTITDNLPSENVDVNFIAGTMCMSTSTLYRKVKALTGISPNEYIRKTKMQMAEDLLLSGQYTFSEIAFKVGMNSVAYFRQCFKDEFGMTPTEYMNGLKQ